MKSKIKICLLLVIICILCTNCASAIESVAESENNTNVTSENVNARDKILSKLTMDKNHVSGQLTDKLSVDVKELNLSEDVGEHAVLAVDFSKIDYQKIANNIFGKEVKLKVEKTLYSDMVASYKLQNNDSFSYSLEDNYLSLFFISDFAIQTQYIFRNAPKISLMSEVGDTRNYLKKNKDLSFLSAKEARKKVESLLMSSGINFLKNAEIYALTKEDLKTTEDYLLKKNELEDLKNGGSLAKGNWSEDDECYYMIFYGGFDDIPVYQWDFSITQQSLGVGTYIEVIYSKEGIRGITIRNPYQLIKEKSSKQKLLTASDALEKLIDYYNGVIMQEQIVLDDCYLCYIPINRKDSIELIPAWYMEVAVEIHTDDGAVHHEYSPLFLNAISGEWITGK